MQKDFQRGEHTESLENPIDRTHRGISSCRPDDVCTLPCGNVLLPFGILIVANFSCFVKSLTYDLYVCTILNLKIVYYIQKQDGAEIIPKA